MKPTPLVTTTLTALALAGFLIVGCKEKSASEQTQEKTADAIQDGAKKVGQSVEKAYDRTKDAVKDGAAAVKNGVQKAGDAVKTGVEKTGEALDKTAEKLKEVGK